MPDDDWNEEEWLPDVVLDTPDDVIVRRAHEYGGVMSYGNGKQERCFNCMTIHVKPKHPQMKEFWILPSGLVQRSEPACPPVQLNIVE